VRGDTLCAARRVPERTGQTTSGQETAGFSLSCGSSMEGRAHAYARGVALGVALSEAGIGRISVASRHVATSAYVIPMRPLLGLVLVCQTAFQQLRESFVRSTTSIRPLRGIFYTSLILQHSLVFYLANVPTTRHLGTRNTAASWDLDRWLSCDVYSAATGVCCWNPAQ
jgi:hypothetical protein